MKRRTLIGGLGSLVVWPPGAHAQQVGMPVIGFLYAAPALAREKRMAAFRQGLAEAGYVEGQNVSILSLNAGGKVDLLPSLAVELVRRQVNVIVSPQSAMASLAARDATRTIPIVFSVTGNPVETGLVASLARPGGNVTGVNNFSMELAAKRLGLLRELLPGGKTVAVLVNPETMVNRSALREAHAAADAFGLQVRVINASTGSEIDAGFAALAGNALTPC